MEGRKQGEGRMGYPDKGTYEGGCAQAAQLVHARRAHSQALGRHAGAWHDDKPHGQGCYMVRRIAETSMGCGVGGGSLVACQRPWQIGACTPAVLQACSAPTHPFFVAVPQWGHIRGRLGGRQEARPWHLPLHFAAVPVHWHLGRGWVAAGRHGWDGETQHARPSAGPFATRPPTVRTKQPCRRVPGGPVGAARRLHLQGPVQRVTAGV